MRAVSDFEYEFQLAGMNKKLNSKIETIFLMSNIENQIISSNFVKEIAELKGDLSQFTTKSTIKIFSFPFNNKEAYKYKFSRFVKIWNYEFTNHAFGISY